LFAIYSIYGDEIKEWRLGGMCSRHGEMRNGCKILVGARERKRPFGMIILTSILKNRVETEWVYLPQDRGLCCVVNTVMNHWVPY
jgi:hypothetical protein